MWRGVGGGGHLPLKWMAPLGRDRCLNRFWVLLGRKMGHVWMPRRQPKRVHSTSKDHSREQQRQRHKDRYGTASKELVSCTKKWTNVEAEALLSSPGSAIRYCLGLDPATLSQASLPLLTGLPPLPRTCRALPHLSTLFVLFPLHGMSSFQLLMSSPNLNLLTCKMDTQKSALTPIIVSKPKQDSGGRRGSEPGEGRRGREGRGCLQSESRAGQGQD